MDSYESIKLYRKRYIPEELIFLKDDKILFHRQNIIITKWNTLKPREDIARGISAYIMDKNIKVSKIFDYHNQFVHWYCDIITTNCPEKDTYIFTDLLIDVIIDPDGVVHVVDMDELGDYIENGTLDRKTASLALHATNELLAMIADKRFAEYQKMIDEAEQGNLKE